MDNYVQNFIKIIILRQKITLNSKINGKRNYHAPGISYDAIFLSILASFGNCWRLSAFVSRKPAGPCQNDSQHFDIR